ncbi:MAG: hypothetical protein ACLS69_02160 [Butyricicoccus sp.]
MPVRSNLTFVAQWWPIVTFDANGGVWSSGEAMRYVKIQTIPRRLAESTPVRNAILSSGWYTAADGGNRANFEEKGEPPHNPGRTLGKNAAVTFASSTAHGRAARRGQDRNGRALSAGDGTASGTLDASYVPRSCPAPGYEYAGGGTDAEH